MKSKTLCEYVKLHPAEKECLEPAKRVAYGVWLCRGHYEAERVDIVTEEPKCATVKPARKQSKKN